MAKKPSSKKGGASRKRAATKPKGERAPRGARGTRVAHVGSTRIEGAKAKAFIDRIEQQQAGLASERADYMNACKPYHEDIKSIYAEAKSAGISPRALKAVVATRALEARAAKQRDDLATTEDANAFDAIRLALGDLDGTPLGEAAKAGAVRGAPEEHEDNEDETERGGSQRRTVAEADAALASLVPGKSPPMAPPAG